MREHSGDILYNFHWVVPGEARARHAGLGRRAEAPFSSGAASAPSSICAAATTICPGGKGNRIAGRAGIAHLDAMLDSRKLPTRRCWCG